MTTKKETRKVAQQVAVSPTQLVMLCAKDLGLADKLAGLHLGSTRSSTVDFLLKGQLKSTVEINKRSLLQDWKCIQGLCLLQVVLPCLYLARQEL